MLTYLKNNAISDLIINSGATYFFTTEGLYIYNIYNIFIQYKD